MPRTRRILIDHGCYHIASKGTNLRTIFHGPKDFERYLSLWRIYVRRFPDVLVHHYCLMGNQIHVLARVGMAAEFPKVMRELHQLYANHYQRTYNHTGHVFHERYKSFPIKTESHLLECGRYMERAPVRSELVLDPNDYRWSSYRFYAEGAPNPLITPDPLYMRLGSSPADRQTYYRTYMREIRPYEKIIDEQLIGRFA